MGTHLPSSGSTDWVACMALRPLTVGENSAVVIKKKKRKRNRRMTRTEFLFACRRMCGFLFYFFNCFSWHHQKSYLSILLWALSKLVEYQMCVSSLSVSGLDLHRETPDWLWVPLRQCDRLTTKLKGFLCLAGISRNTTNTSPLPGNLFFPLRQHKR